jgi:hypothetical protein
MVSPGDTASNASIILHDWTGMLAFNRAASVAFTALWDSSICLQSVYEPDGCTVGCMCESCPSPISPQNSTPTAL